MTTLFIFENGVDVVTLKFLVRTFLVIMKILTWLLGIAYLVCVCMRECGSGRVASPENTLRIRNPTPEPNAFALVSAIYTVYRRIYTHKVA